VTFVAPTATIPLDGEQFANGRGCQQLTGITARVRVRDRRLRCGSIRYGTGECGTGYEAEAKSPFATDRPPLVPAQRVGVGEPLGAVGDNTKRQPRWVLQDPPVLHLPDPCGAQLLEAGDLGVDVGGVDVDVHTTGAVVDTLDEDPDVLPGNLAQWYSG
jgi:hypothetical protein